jgi:tRNA-dependent cyclodipeptide synthase
VGRTTGSSSQKTIEDSFTHNLKKLYYSKTSYTRGQKEAVNRAPTPAEESPAWQCYGRKSRENVTMRNIGKSGCDRGSYFRRMAKVPKNPYTAWNGLVLNRPTPPKLMRIAKYLNVTKEEMERKEFNIFFGLSLGNKYFTREHIRAYLLWATENTKEKIAVLIPDKIQAVNYEVKNGYAPERALSVALRKGVEIEEMVKAVIQELNISESQLRVAHWQEIEDDEYRRMRDVIATFFSEDKKFRDSVVQMVRETPHIQNLNLTEDEHARLAQYILDELPVLISGLTVDGIHYGLFPYPGFANLDYLALDLQQGTAFPELSAQLDQSEKLRFIELYAD